MDEFALIAAGLKLAYAVAGIVLVIGLSSWLDHRAKEKFSVIIGRMMGDAKALALYYGLRILGLCILVGLLAGCASAAQAGPVFSSRYDGEIKRAVGQWWPDYPFPAAWKAQLYQESRLDPGAVSPVGAAGLAQFMPGTWAEVSRELRLGALSPHHEVAVEAGAYYMAKLRRAWTAKRETHHRHQLAQASYNAGTGNIIKAQAKCGGPPLWSGIAPCLEAVTGERNAHETRTYVERIAKWRGMMEAGL